MQNKPEFSSVLPVLLSKKKMIIICYNSFSFLQPFWRQRPLTPESGGIFAFHAKRNPKLERSLDMRDAYYPPRLKDSVFSCQKVSAPRFWSG